MDKSLAKHGFHRDDVTDVLWHIYILTIVVEGTMEQGIKQAMNRLSKMLNYGWREVPKT
jgi:NTP pyrophosphatase (non-canonical NTP hydrolase)